MRAARRRSWILSWLPPSAQVVSYLASEREALGLTQEQVDTMIALAAER